MVNVVLFIFLCGAIVSILSAFGHAKDMVKENDGNNGARFGCLIANIIFAIIILFALGIIRI